MCFLFPVGTEKNPFLSWSLKVTYKFKIPYFNPRKLAPKPQKTEVSNIIYPFKRER